MAARWKYLNRGTGFYEPRAYGTLTIPATARRVMQLEHMIRWLTLRFFRKAAECRHI